MPNVEVIVKNSSRLKAQLSYKQKLNEHMKVYRCAICEDYYWDTQSKYCLKHRGIIIRKKKIKIKKIDDVLKIRKNKSKRKGIALYLRVQVYKRSGNFCEICRSPGKAVHHIKSVYEYPLLQFELSNLIHLCLECHANRHLNMPRTIFIKNKFITRKPFYSINKI